MKTFMSLVSAFFMAILLNGCLDVPEVIENIDDSPLAEVNAPIEFSYKTEQQVEVNLNVPLNLNSAVFSLYAYSSRYDSLKFATASFDINGNFSS